MHNSIQKLNQLEPETQIYCAHEYTESNLKFVLSEIADEFIEDYFKKISAKRSKGEISIPTTLELERKINPFLLHVEFRSLMCRFLRLNSILKCILWKN